MTNVHFLPSYYRGIGHKSLLVREIAIGIKLFIHLIEDLNQSLDTAGT
jgi:hypothetical protein